MIDAEPLPKVQYRYGPTDGKAELEFVSNFEPTMQNEGYDLRSGEGQTHIALKTGDMTYHVEYFDPDPEESFLNVNKAGQGVALFSKTCDQNSVTVNFDPLWDALDNGGWYYIYDSDTSGWVDKKHIK